MTANIDFIAYGEVAPIASIPFSLTSLEYKRFDVNNISMRVNRNGVSARVPTSGIQGGFEWPKGSGQTAVFSIGFWLAAEVNGDVRTSVAEYFSADFSPGPVINGTGADPRNAEYRMYKIDSNSGPGDQDFDEWPVHLGAPSGLIGDQTLFAVYNDVGRNTGNRFSTSHLGAEIQQTIYGYDDSGPAGDVVYINYKVINKSTSTWNDAYFSLWNDSDIGFWDNDLVGLDESRNMAYTYNGTALDDVYGSTPPAVGFNIIESANPDNPVTAFAYYSAGSVYPSSDPQTEVEAYNFMRGLRSDGSSYVDPTTGIATVFPLGGDPVAQTGWYDEDPGDRRSLISFGPFNLAPGESKEVLAAVIVGQGTDNINSITVLKSKYDE